MAMSVNADRPLSVVLLGSTGSIGTSTLDVIASLPERFRILGLAAGKFSKVFEEQINRLRPEFIATRDGVDAGVLAAKRLEGPGALTKLATLEDADIVVIATTGHTAIEPTLAALHAGKVVALANKETIVAAGELVMAASRNAPGLLRPVDSEHSAIWQCLGSVGTCPPDVRRLILTASGGPFRGRTMSDLVHATPESALKHPNWTMGPKVTIDSSTLMNKGLELIEASWLFDVQPDDIDVIIHPQSVVHSMIEYLDGSIIAQLGPHDMRLPIQFALTWPEHVPSPAAPLKLVNCGPLEFEAPDDVTFPAINLARDAARRGSTYPTVLSSADEAVVSAFLARRIGFVDMMAVVERVMDAHRPESGHLTVDAIHVADLWAQSAVEDEIRRLA
jgi:1-deoxy-D-xylulose-5-phosphate reductoisomerase